jgi:hypothetical protein
MSRVARERTVDLAGREPSGEDLQALIAFNRRLSEADARLADAIAEMVSPTHVSVAETPDGAAHLKIRGMLPWPRAVQLLETLKGQPGSA